MTQATMIEIGESSFNFQFPLPPTSNLGPSPLDYIPISFSNLFFPLCSHGCYNLFNHLLPRLCSVFYSQWIFQKKIHTYFFLTFNPSVHPLLFLKVFFKDIFMTMASGLLDLFKHWQNMHCLMIIQNKHKPILYDKDGIAPPQDFSTWKSH